MTVALWKRAIAKSMVWKVVGVVTLVATSLLAGATLVQVGKITVLYHVATLLLYVLHERAWNSIQWGKTTGSFTDIN